MIELEKLYMRDKEMRRQGERQRPTSTFFFECAYEKEEKLMKIRIFFKWNLI